MIEIDLHRTRDGAIVVTHDEELAGLGGRGEIADATLAEVRALDAGGGERVPTLDEVLDGFGARIPLQPRAEARHARPSTRGSRRRRSRALERARPRSSARSSRRSTTRCSRACAALAPGARIGAPDLARATRTRALERARALGAEALHPERRAGRRRSWSTAAHGDGPRRLRLHGRRPGGDARACSSSASTGSSPTSRTGCGALCGSPGGIRARVAYAFLLTAGAPRCRIHSVWRRSPPNEIRRDTPPSSTSSTFSILERCRRTASSPLAAIGEKVGLTAPSVLERIHKLEEAGVIRDYVAVLDARALGKDVTAFIGVSIDEPARARAVRAGGRARSTTCSSVTT